MKPVWIAAGTVLLLALSSPALAAAPSATSPATPSAKPAQLAQYHDRDRDRDRYRDRDHRRDPHAYRERYPRGVYGRPHWSRGDRLYRDYRAPRYYVDDWRRYHLRRPPRGYRWVRVNDDFLLVAITTGIIMDVILMNQMNRPY